MQPLNTAPHGLEGQELEGDNHKDECHSGIWLFTDIENIAIFIKPNLLPPYEREKKSWRS